RGPGRSSADDGPRRPGGRWAPQGGFDASVLHHQRVRREMPDVARSCRWGTRQRPRPIPLPQRPAPWLSRDPTPHCGARATRAPTRCQTAGPERFTVIDALEGSTLLTLFLVVATGAVLGAIPFGRIRLGAAGALFTGLALSAIAPHIGEGMEIVQTLGLALFVYTVGISAGAAFFGTLNRQLPLLAAATVSTILAAAATLVLGQVLGLARDLSLGLFTAALTAAPALDAAARLTGTGPPSVQ